MTLGANIVYRLVSMKRGEPLSSRYDQHWKNLSQSSITQHC